MFQVVHKETGELRTVYGFSGTIFLFWDHEKSCWMTEDIGKYVPVGVPI